jgi:hypothetical protein
VPVSFAAVRVATAEICSSGEVTVYIGAQVHVRCPSWPDLGLPWW